MPTPLFEGARQAVLEKGASHDGFADTPAGISVLFLPRRSTIAHSPGIRRHRAFLNGFKRTGSMVKLKIDISGCIDISSWHEPNTNRIHRTSQS